MAGAARAAAALALPLVFAGLIFRWFFEYNQGIANAILRGLGLEPLNWLTSPGLAFFAICLAIIWKSSSFVALVLLAGLQTIPKSFYEAAEVDGATKWQQFREIHAAHAAAGDLCRADLPHHHRHPDLRYSLCHDQWRAGNSTETLAMYIHKTTVDFLDLGYGSALAVLMFIVSALITSVYLRHTRRDPGRHEHGQKKWKPVLRNRFCSHAIRNDLGMASGQSPVVMPGLTRASMCVHRDM